MLKIKKFLYFIELESGVNFIGYVGIFASLILSIAFLLTSAFSFNDVIDYIKERYVVHKADLPGIRKPSNFHRINYLITRALFSSFYQRFLSFSS